MGCCLAALISELPAPAEDTIHGATTSSFLARIARQDEDDEEDTRLLQEMDEAIITYDDSPSTCSVAAPVQQTTNVVASTPPPVVRAQQYNNTGKKRSNANVVKRKVDDLTFSWQEQEKRKRAPEKEMSKQHDHLTIK
jgi:hypothetical protein